MERKRHGVADSVDDVRRSVFGERDDLCGGEQVVLDFETHEEMLDDVRVWSGQVCCVVGRIIVRHELHRTNEVVNYGGEGGGREPGCGCRGSSSSRH